MPEPTDMIMPMLREMREETRLGFAELRGEMRSRFDEVDARLRAVERLVKAQREAFEGEPPRKWRNAYRRSNGRSEALEARE